MRNTIKAIIICIVKATEKTVCSFEEFFPNSNVIKRDVAPDIVAFRNENIATSPPTTL